MYFAYPEGGAVMFASEPGTIIAAALRNGLVLKKEPYMISDNHLIQYKINDDKTWEPEYTNDMDIAYRQSNGPFRPVQNYHALACAYDNTAPVRTIPQTSSTVTHSIHYYMGRGKFTDDFATTYSAAQAMAEQQTKTSFTEQSLVSWTDYLPANNDPQCRSWYIYGTAMSSLEDADRMLHYCLLFDKDEKTVMEMVYNEFYFVNTGTAQLHTVPCTEENGSVTQKHVAVTYCSNPTKAEVTRHKQATQQ